MRNSGCGDVEDVDVDPSSPGSKQHLVCTQVTPVLVSILTATLVIRMSFTAHGLYVTTVHSVNYVCVCV